MNREQELARLQRFYQSEMGDHLTYSGLAARVRDPALRALLERTAATERRHADFWAERIRALGGTLPRVRPPRLRLALVAMLLWFLPPRLVIGTLELGETGAAQDYFAVWREPGLDETVRQRLHDIILDELEHEASFRREAENAGLANVRDFILGMNDGLVEILGAVTGLSAAYPGNPLVVGVSGLIVGIAGALSMGIGAFISVRSQRQVNEANRRQMEILFAVAPERARDRFRERLAETGLPDEVGEELAGRLGEDAETIGRLLIEPVKENEWRSAFFTGLAYLFGVIFPVLPYFLAEQSLVALAGSVLLAGAALATVGGLVSALSGIPPRTKILEMTVSGFAAAGLAYLFGRLMQVWFGVEI